MKNKQRKKKQKKQFEKMIKQTYEKNLQIQENLIRLQKKIDNIKYE